MSKSDSSSLQIEQWDVARLVPYARNPRINDIAAGKLAGLIKEFGFKVPLVIRSDGTIIDGHERYKAAQILGLQHVPCVIADDWTDTQVKAFRLAVNRSAEWASWDSQLLKLELDDLKTDEFDLQLIDFDQIDIALNGQSEQGGVDPVTGEKDKPKPKPVDSNIYTGKISIPTYEPTGKKVSVDDCYDLKKYNTLVDRIENSSLSVENKIFLAKAASRHIVFNYENIAELYANASAEMQELMEESGLVIIDVKKAITYGFVEFSKTLEKIFDAQVNKNDED